MDHRHIIAARLLAMGLTMAFAIGCTAARGGLGADWVSRKPAPSPSVESAPAQGQPPQEPAHRDQAEHVYRYYPASEVYYDTERRIYFYIDGGAWESDALLPYDLRQRLGRCETVKLSDDTPYGYHGATHKKTYRVLPRQGQQDEDRGQP